MHMMRSRLCRHNHRTLNPELTQTVSTHVQLGPWVRLHLVQNEATQHLIIVCVCVGGGGAASGEEADAGFPGRECWLQQE
jgi:hypothetical protein